MVNYDKALFKLYKLTGNNQHYEIGDINITQIKARLNSLTEDKLQEILKAIIKYHPFIYKNNKHKADTTLETITKCFSSKGYQKIISTIHSLRIDFALALNWNADSLYIPKTEKE